MARVWGLLIVLAIYYFIRFLVGWHTRPEPIKYQRARAR